MTTRQGKRAIVTAQTYNPRLLSWKKIRKAIIKIEADAFPQYDPQEEILEQDFLNKNNIVIILRSSRQSIIGYAYAEPIGQLNPRRKKENADTAYITSIAIHPNFQGKGLAAHLHKALDMRLKKRGYSFLEGHVVNDKYLNSLTRIYADQIVKKRRMLHEEEMKHFVRISLNN